MTERSIDFDAVREQTRFETVLARYGLEAKGKGAERMILCPFHDDRTPSCSVNLGRKVFHCFACGAGGSILDFVARMESVSLIEAARLIASWSDLCDLTLNPTHTKRERTEKRPANPPLDFALTLDPEHPYLASRGLSRQTVDRFGLGFCNRGVMKGRICIPIHDAQGRLVAQAGRWPGSPRQGEPRYRFPRGFRKSVELFNYHRVADAKHLVIVEGFWSVFRLDALDVAAVALLGCSLSEEQEALIRRLAADRMTLLLDGDAAGRAATAQILPRLTRWRVVHAPNLPEGLEPDSLDEADLKAAIGCEVA
ncbi:MAG: CHC2 zinc finger domain-containing protein [Alphaproteobacteria bacterium]|jgi:DNA primase